MYLLALLIFIPLQILWLPLTLIGAILVAYRQLVVSKREGVSQTAVEILNGRWAMDVFDLQEDAAARKLARGLPNNSVFGLWLSLFPLWIVTKLTRRPFLYPTLPKPERAGIANLIPLRTVAFDQLIQANLRACTQFVILGAGLDTRAYGQLGQTALAIFEVDETRNQKHKRAALAKASIDAAHVHFVEADFAQDDWMRSLLATKYNPDKPTIFLWEGVTLYLSRRAVSQTLQNLKANAASGSVVLTDIYADRFLSLTRGKAISWALEMTEEEMQFGLGFGVEAESVLEGFAAANDTQLRRYQFLGESNKKGPFVVIAELVL